MMYVVFNKNGVVGATEDFAKVEKLLNSPFADMMEYSYEVRPANQTTTLDKF